MLDFTNNSFYPNVAPTDQEIELSKQRALHAKSARLTDYHVRVFDMSLNEDVQEYEKLIPELFDKVYKKTCVVWAKERALVDGKWKIYLEWADYTVEKQNEEE